MNYRTIILGLSFFALSFLFVWQEPSLAGPSPRLLFERLTGAPLLPNDSRYSQVRKLLNDGNITAAARIAVDDPRFIDVVMRDFSSQMISLTDDPYIPLNDALLLAMGIAHDDLDIKTLLTGNFRYEPDRRFGLTAALNNNNAFERLEKKPRYVRYIQKISPQWNFNRVHSAAGILTTRGWAQLYYNAGTNRRAVQGVFHSFLCTPIDTWKEAGLDDFRVRQDIPRTPGENSATYQKECRTCHAPMDAMAGAFARMNFDTNTFVFERGIAQKYSQNSTVYPEGYITADSSWMNILTTNESRFGWSGAREGDGLESFAKMIADSSGFKSCMVKRVFKKVCLKDLDLEDSTIKQVSSSLGKDDFKFKTLFTKVVSHEACGLFSAR